LPISGRGFLIARLALRRKGRAVTATIFSYENQEQLGPIGPAAVKREASGKRLNAFRRYRFSFCLAAIVVLFVVAVVWPYIFVTVPAGHVAVKWYRFKGGTDTARAYGEGTRFMYPWDRIEIYEARVQQVNRDFDVLTRDGLTMAINIAVRFRLNEPMIADLHKRVGPDYLERLLIPAVGAYARQVFSQNSTEGIYTARRSSVQDEIKQAVVADLSPRSSDRPEQNGSWVIIEDVLIRSMRFPPVVQAAIDRKMEQYQLKQEYAYRLEREHLESERKEIEAQGIAKFQTIVRAGISDGYLRWKGIDATLALAQSPNAKVVLIGTPKDGMPLILGGDATTTSPPGAASVTDTVAEGGAPNAAAASELRRNDTTSAASSASGPASATTPRAARPAIRAQFGRPQALNFSDYASSPGFHRVPSSADVNVPNYVLPDVSISSAMTEDKPSN
jgi:regulator of protease activity HflC (stomatin/prohibitin superfamily)